MPSSIALCGWRTQQQISSGTDFILGQSTVESTHLICLNRGGNPLKTESVVVFLGKPQILLEGKICVV